MNTVILDPQTSEPHYYIKGKSICRSQCRGPQKCPLTEFRKSLSITCGHFFHRSPRFIYKVQTPLATLRNCLSSITGITELMTIRLILLGRIQKLSCSLDDT